MKVLCIGGHNDGKMVDIDPAKRDGESHTLTYRVKLKGSGVDVSEPYPMGGIDDELTFCGERYTVRDIHFSSHELVRVLVSHPSASYPWILKALIKGYRQPKGDIT